MAVRLLSHLHNCKVSTAVRFLEQSVSNRANPGMDGKVAASYAVKTFSGMARLALAGIARRTFLPPEFG